MVEIRPSRKEDIFRQKEVWRSCFGDDERFIDLFYQTYYVPEETVVLLEEGQVASMAALLPMELRLPGGQHVQAGYVYALATDPAVQKKGFARHVLHYADFYLKELGRQCVILVPASPSLHRFFDTVDYRECFATRKVELLRTQLIPAHPKDTITPVEPAEYNRIRDSLLEGTFYVHYEENMIALQRDICRLSGPGADLYRITVDGVEGCAAVEYYQQDRVLVKELLLPPAQMSRAATQIARVVPVGHYHLRTPAFWEGLQGSYIQAFGMVKWYDPQQEQIWFREREGYLGFGFD